MQVINPGITNLSLFCLLKIYIKSKKIKKFHIDSYKNVGWKNFESKNINGLFWIGINSFQGKLVGMPNASLLKKFPQRPIDCPIITEGIIISRNDFKDKLFFLQKIKIDKNPPINAPCMAMPPSQIARKEGTLNEKFRKFT